MGRVCQSFLLLCFMYNYISETSPEVDQPFRFDCQQSANFTRGSPNTSTLVISAIATQPNTFRNNLHGLPINRSRITRLIVNGCKVTPDITFDAFSRLSALELIDVQLESFNVGRLTSELRELRLDNNMELKTLTGSSRVPLRIISLRNTGFEHTHDEGLVQFAASLRVLNISGDGFAEKAVDTCRHFPLLEDLNGNQCKDFKDYIWPNDDNEIADERILMAGNLTGVSRKRLVRTFRMSGMNLSHVARDTFNAFDNLVELHLHNNCLRAIEIESLSIKILDVSNNCIEAFHSDDFKDLPQLQCIDLSGNRLRTIEWSLQTELLREINLASNNGLGRVLIEAKNVTDLVIANNTLHALTLQTPSLKRIDMRGCNFTQSVSLWSLCNNLNKWQPLKLEYLTEENQTSTFNCAMLHTLAYMFKSERNKIPVENEANGAYVHVDVSIMSTSPYKSYIIIMAVMHMVLLPLLLYLGVMVRRLYSTFEAPGEPSVHYDRVRARVRLAESHYEEVYGGHE